MKEIVIKISEANYKSIMANRFEISVFAPIGLTVSNAIRNGKVLPKGHGRIVDLDKFESNFNKNCCEECGCCSSCLENHRCGIFADAETLLEADKGEE